MRKKARKQKREQLKLTAATNQHKHHRTTHTHTLTLPTHIDCVANLHHALDHRRREKNLPLTAREQ